MTAHLRPQPRCRNCNHPATQGLYNTWNALIGTFCERHAKAALREFLARNEGQG